MSYQCKTFFLDTVAPKYCHDLSLWYQSFDRSYKSWYLDLDQNPCENYQSSGLWPLCNYVARPYAKMLAIQREGMSADTSLSPFILNERLNDLLYTAPLPLGNPPLPIPVGTAFKFGRFITGWRYEAPFSEASSTCSVGNSEYSLINSFTSVMTFSQSLLLNNRAGYYKAVKMWFIIWKMRNFQEKTPCCGFKIEIFKDIPMVTGQSYGQLDNMAKVNVPAALEWVISKPIFKLDEDIGSPDPDAAMRLRLIPTNAYGGDLKFKYVERMVYITSLQACSQFLEATDLRCQRDYVLPSGRGTIPTYSMWFVVPKDTMNPLHILDKDDREAFLGTFEKTDVTVENLENVVNNYITRMKKDNPLYSVVQKAANSYKSLSWYSRASGRWKLINPDYRDKKNRYGVEGGTLVFKKECYKGVGACTYSPSCEGQPNQLYDHCISKARTMYNANSEVVLNANGEIVYEKPANCVQQVTQGNGLSILSRAWSSSTKSYKCVDYESLVGYNNYLNGNILDNTKAKRLLPFITAMDETLLRGEGDTMQKLESCRYGLNIYCDPYIVFNVADIQWKKRTFKPPSDKDVLPENKYELNFLPVNI